jgi:hypothetical protein
MEWQRKGNMIVKTPILCEDPRSVPFNIDVAYAVGGGTAHGRYVKVSIVLY